MRVRWKELFLVAALTFTPVSACSLLNPSPPTTTPDAATVTQAHRDLHVAELAYQGALKTIQVLVRNKVIKGAKAAAVQKAVLTAKAALDVARTAVDSGRVDMSIILTASTKVIELLALYKQ